MVLRRHLLMTATRRVHIRDVRNFTGRGADTTLLFTVGTVRSLRATGMVLRVRRSSTMARCSGRFSTFARLGHLALLFFCYSVHDAGDLHVFGLGELSEDGLQLATLNQTGQLEVVLRAVLHLCVGVPRVLDQVAAPHALLLNRESLRAMLVRQLDAHRDVKRRRGQQT